MNKNTMKILALGAAAAFAVIYLTRVAEAQGVDPIGALPGTSPKVA